MKQRLVTYIQRHFTRISILFFILFFGLLGLSGWFVSRNISFNYELESFFPQGSDELEFYLDHISRFESDHDVVLVSLTSGHGIYDQSFLRQVEEFADTLTTNRFVTQVVSPLDINRMRITNTGVIKLPFFHVSTPEKYVRDSIRLATTRHFIRNFVSHESGSLFLLVKVKPAIGIDNSGSLISFIKKQAKSVKDARLRMAGRVRAQTYIVRKMQNEFIMLSLVTTVVLIVFLFYTFRNFWGIVLPMAVVLAAMLFTLACILMFTGSLNLLSVILPTVLFIVGVSDSVHIISAYNANVNSGMDRKAAVFETVRETGSAVFATSVTSAAGFMALGTVRIKPIAEFGIYSGVGIMIAYGISMSLLVCALYLFQPHVPSRSKELVKVRWIDKLYAFVTRRRKRILIVTVIAFVPMLIGTGMIKTNNYFTEDLRANDPYRQDFDFFDRYLGGVRPFELSVHVKEGKTVFDPEIVRQLDRLEKYLAEKERIGSLLSSNTILRLANHMNSLNPDSFELPSGTEAWEKAKYTLDRAGADELRALVTPDLKYARVTGRINDIGAIRAAEMNERVMHFIDKNLDPDVFECRITGISEVVDGNVRHLTANMITGLLLELLVIAFFMGMLLRSVKMMLLSLIPNLLPLFAVACLMGFGDVHLNVSSSIIFCIAFGICVDDTIHILSRYRLEKKKGYTEAEAMHRSLQISGKAVVMTSVILFTGFCVLMLSSFKGIFNTGYLIGVTIVVALVCDLLVLPVLFGRKKD